MVSSILCILMFGTIDLFNYAISYMQLGFFGDQILNSYMQNKEGFRAGPTPARLGEVVRARRNITPTGSEKDTFFFMFDNNASDPEMTFTLERGKSQSATRASTGRTGPSMGATHCVTVKRKLRLIFGQAVFGTKEHEIEKVVCAIQESPYACTGCK